MPDRDPLSVHYDAVVHQLVIRAIYAQRSRRGVQAWVSSPRHAARDQGGRTPNERAFTRSAYYLVWRVPINEGVPPAWSLRLTWGGDAELKPSARGRLARPVVLRVWPRGEARVRGPRWAGTELQSTVGNRIDD